MSCPHGNPIGGCDTCDEVDAAFEAGKRSALAEQPAQQQEPVAWGNFKEDGTLVGLSQHPEDQANWTGRKPLYTSPQPAQQEPVTVLPDGSAFAVMSYPLPKDHWLYADRQYNDGEYEPVELGKPVLTHELRDAVVSAVRYAIRGATNCGKEVDFDPDALVQNAVYALCGPFTSPPAQRKPLTDEWVPVTQSLLNEQHPWFYQPMWIAMKDGAVLQGHYEWRQGWNPDRFIADGFDHWAFDADYVMPVIKPTPPTIEAAHGIKENT